MHGGVWDFPRRQTEQCSWSPQGVLHGLGCDQGVSLAPEGVTGGDGPAMLNIRGGSEKVE